jgi:hypothetical protein
MDDKSCPMGTWHVLVNVGLILALWLIDSPFQACRRALERLRTER